MTSLLILLVVPLAFIGASIFAWRHDSMEKSIVYAFGSAALLLIIFIANHNVFKQQEFETSCMSRQIIKIDLPSQGPTDITICTERKQINE